jgi:hypothetical protein
MRLFAGQRSTRSIKISDKDNQNEAELVANPPSHKLWRDNIIGGNGTLFILAEALTALEEKCNDLSPWKRENITCKAWRKQLSDASCTWAIDCVMQMGLLADEKDSNDGNNSHMSPYKKHYVESISGSSYVNLFTTIKVRVLEAAGAASFELVTIGKADEGDDDTVLSMVAAQRKGQQEDKRMAVEERACDKEAAWMSEQHEEAHVIADQGVCDEEATKSKNRQVEGRSALWLASIAVLAFLSFK